MRVSECPSGLLLHFEVILHQAATSWSEKCNFCIGCIVTSGCKKTKQDDFDVIR